MKVLCTPDDRFVGLPDYSFSPNYRDVPDGSGGSLRVHFIDEGPPAAPPVILMHGEPSWSYLYRTMIPVLVDAGHRCIAPDLVGFGRSDKPAARSDYTYARHVAWMRSLLVDELAVTQATFFGQDWGGLVGLRIVASNPDRFDRVVVGNTGLPTGDRPPTDAFFRWQEFSQTTPVFPVGNLVKGGTASSLSDDEVAAYDAPFPDDSYKEGARQFPALVPTRPDDPASADNRQAWEVFERWDKPFLTAFSDGDPITAGGEREFQRRIPGARDRAHVTIEGAAHFLQEDKGPELAQVIARFIEATP